MSEDLITKIKQWNDKKVILVGPSKSLLKDKLGSKIDSFDVVCRMNSAGRPDVVTEENKHIIGIKKNIWLCKHIAWLSMFGKNDYDEIVGFGQLGDSVINTLPDITKKACAKGKPTLDKCIKTLKEFNNNDSRPSCGILSIFYLLNRFNKVHICGMDGFKDGHFYGNKFLQNQNESDALAAKGIGAHNVIKEVEYIEHLISKNKIKRLI